MLRGNEEDQLLFESCSSVHVHKTQVSIPDRSCLFLFHSQPVILFTMSWVSYLQMGCGLKLS